jgi:hypothetical protein
MAGFAWTHGVDTIGGLMAAVCETRDVTRDEENREKIRAEIMKLIAETSKIHAESRWYPLVAGAGFFAASMGASLAFIKLVQLIFF